MLSSNGGVQSAPTCGPESGKARKRDEQLRKMAVSGKKQSGKRAGLAYQQLI